MSQRSCNFCACCFIQSKSRTLLPLPFLLLFFFKLRRDKRTYKAKQKTKTNILHLKTYFLRSLWSCCMVSISICGKCMRYCPNLERLIVFSYAFSLFLLYLACVSESASVAAFCSFISLLRWSFHVFHCLRRYYCRLTCPFLCDNLESIGDGVQKKVEYHRKHSKHQ